MTDPHARGFCPRCLAGEVPGGEALAERLRAWIAAVPPEQRADEAAVRARLGACRRCPWLDGGLCGQCGCYVELRATKRNQFCPDVPPRWRE